MIISDKEYAPSKMGLKLLELVLASKNCSAAWFSRAFPRYLCIVEQVKDTPRAPFVRGVFVYRAYEQWADPNFGLRLGDIQISLGLAQDKWVYGRTPYNNNNNNNLSYRIAKYKDILRRLLRVL